MGLTNTDEKEHWNVVEEKLDEITRLLELVIKALIKLHEAINNG
jgi:hypothetical protein